MAASEEKPVHIAGLLSIQPKILMLSAWMIRLE